MMEVNTCTHLPTERHLCIRTDFKLLQVETLHSSLSTRLGALGRKHVVSNPEHSVENLKRWWEELLGAEAAYEEQMKSSLTNLKKIAQLISLYQSKTHKLDTWLAAKAGWLQVSIEAVAGSLPARPAGESAVMVMAPALLGVGGAGQYEPEAFTETETAAAAAGTEGGIGQSIAEFAAVAALDAREAEADVMDAVVDVVVSGEAAGEAEAASSDVAAPPPEDGFGMDDFGAPPTSIGCEGRGGYCSPPASPLPSPPNSLPPSPPPSPPPEEAEDEGDALAPLSSPGLGGLSVPDADVAGLPTASFEERGRSDSKTGNRGRGESVFSGYALSHTH